MNSRIMSKGKNGGKTNLDYSEFLVNKLAQVQPTGFAVDESAVTKLAFPFQRQIIVWALKLGKAAIFAECGLGKTLMQLEWAKHVAEYTGGKVLILAPLAVAHQTVNEGVKFGVAVKYIRDTAEVNNDCSVYISNYEMLKHLDTLLFDGVVLDESSILKAYTGKTKREIITAFSTTRYKLACTATPSPNDYLELGNHADFLDVMESNEMISRWFINDTMRAGGYRLKNHAAKDYWRWVTQWAVGISKPSDLGFEDDGFNIPELIIHDKMVSVDHTRAFSDGRLFLDATLSATNMWKEKRETAADRCALAKEIVDANPGQVWTIWCDTNDEADTLIKLFPQAVEVRGSHSIKVKEERLNAFSDGQAQIIITKPDIAGFGLNWQHCHNVIFVGVSYSFEKTYQALRRSWRFGQKHEVNAYLIYAESEGSIMQTLRRKQDAHRKMQHAINSAMRANGLSNDNGGLMAQINIETRTEYGKNWTLHLNDCVQAARNFPDNSIDYSVFSPPFSTLYIYGDNVADMGNCVDNDEFFEQYRYLIKELHRVIKPGRLVSVHCKDLPLYMNHDGAAGLYDFPGDCIVAMEDAGFTFHSRVTVWKDPVIEMQRTKNHGLLYKNFRQRGEVSRQGMADYVLTFRKWEGVEGSESEVPVLHDPNEFPLEVWQRWASPVWMDIDQTNVLNYYQAKSSEDEKHICPLQLDVIERCIALWSNKGDLVFSPFTGIGSEGYVALKMGRKFIGTELKESYFISALKYLKEAEESGQAVSMFDVLQQTENA